MGECLQRQPGLIAGSVLAEELFDAVAEVLKWVEAVLKAQGDTAPWTRPPKAEGEAGAEGA